MSNTYRITRSYFLTTNSQHHLYFQFFQLVKQILGRHPPLLIGTDITVEVGAPDNWIAGFERRILTSCISTSHQNFDPCLTAPRITF